MDFVSNEANGKVHMELTQTENELYDRQIRLWGLESQKRLHAAKIFISGLNGLGAEVTKNIILAGVHAVTLHDEKHVTEEDMCAQFLIPSSALGKNRAEASVERARVLNPLVNISVDTSNLLEKSPDFFYQYDVVVIIGATNAELVLIDNMCREKGVKFFSGDVWGLFGYCFADLQDHTFVEDTVKHKIISKPNEKIKTELVTTTIQRELKYPSYEALLHFNINTPEYQKRIKRVGPTLILSRVLQQFREVYDRDPSYKSRKEDITELERILNIISSMPLDTKDIFEHVFSQISPAAAVVGGILSQEIIKVVTKKEAPYRNIFLFDPRSNCGFIETIGVD